MWFALGIYVDIPEGCMPQAKLPARIPGEKKKSGISAVYFFTECGMFLAAHA